MCSDECKSVSLAEREQEGKVRRKAALFLAVFVTVPGQIFQVHSPWTFSLRDTNIRQNRRRQKISLEIKIIIANDKMIKSHGILA